MHRSGAKGVEGKPCTKNSSVGGLYVLIGNAKHTIDIKGRMFIPSKFRYDLGTEVILAKGNGKFLYIFSMEFFNSFCAKLTEMSLHDRQIQNYLRKFSSNAEPVNVDKQGRILIPQFLRDFAELGDEAQCVGVLNRAEIWSVKNWQEFDEQETQAELDDVFASLAQKGI